MFTNSSKYIIIVFCSFFYAMDLVGQDHKKDILSIYNNFLSQKNYSVTIKYNLYLDKEIKPFQSREVIMCKDQTNLYMKESNGIETVSNSRYQLFINHKKKLISAIKTDPVGDSKNPEASEIYKELTSQMDSIVLLFDKIKVVSNSDDIVKYECDPKKALGISKIWLEVDKKKHIYKSIKTAYSEPVQRKEFGEKKRLMTIEIVYEGYKLNNTYPATLFDEKKYITESSTKEVKLKPAFKDYELLSSQ
jgi:hypothetical protein